MEDTEKTVETVEETVETKKTDKKRLSVPTTILVTIAGTLLAICVIRLVYFLVTGV